MFVCIPGRMCVANGYHARRFWIIPQNQAGCKGEFEARFLPPSQALRYSPLSHRALTHPVPAPLALSRFLRRALVSACKTRSAAPGCRYPNWRRARGALANLDGCPCSSSAVSAAGSASLTQPLTAPCFCRRQRSPFAPRRETSRKDRK